MSFKSGRCSAIDDAARAVNNVREHEAEAGSTACMNHRFDGMERQGKLACSRCALGGRHDVATRDHCPQQNCKHAFHVAERKADR